MPALALWPILAALGASGIFTLAQGEAHGRAWSRLAEQREQLLALDAPGQSACSAISGPDRMPCGTHQIGQAECTALGCCFDPQSSLAPCYYAGKVTAHCTPDGEFSIALSKDATMPELSLDQIRPRSSQGGHCAPVAQNGRFALFRFSVSACGTTFKASGSRRIYENVLQTDQRVLASRLGSVTRDSDFRLTVRCSYLAEEALPASVVVATFPPPVVVAQQGPLTLEMRIAHDEKYSSFYSEDDYPVVKLLRDPVYVEVRLLGRADPALILVLHECWATSSTSPLQRPEWPLLVSGCPYKGDNYQTRRLPVMAVTALRFPSHHQHFVIRTFTLADVRSERMLRGPVYLHCSASACAPSGEESCQASCEEAPQSRRRRDPADLPPAGEWMMLVTSSGPVEFFDKANAVSVQESEEEVSRLLPQGGIGRWDDVLFLVAGTVGILAVSVVVIVILRKHWRRLQALGGPPCA